MDKLRTISTASILTALLSAASTAHGTRFVEPCGEVLHRYKSLVERLMRDALPADIAPLVIRYATPRYTESGIGISSRADGYHLVRASFDRSLWYESWVNVEDVPDDVDLSAVDGVATVIYREDGGPLGHEIQDFKLVEPRVAISSIPVSDSFANALTEVLEGFEPASSSEKSDVIVTDGISMDIVQTNGRCLSISPRLDRESAATMLMELLRYLENEMGAWRAYGKEAFETEASSMMRGVKASK